MPTNWLGKQLQLPRSKTIYHGLPEKMCIGLPHPSSLQTTFAFLGRLVSTKGVQTLLEAAQQLSAEGIPFLLKVIGDGPDRKVLQQQAVTMGLRESVQFLGYLPPESLEEHLAEVAVVVVPSLAGEVFGMVAAESMSRGKLVVVSDVGAMREVIGNAGLCFPPGDINGLASCLRRALKDPGLVVEMGTKARNRAHDLFRVEHMAFDHLAVYHQLMQESGRLL